MVKHYFNDRKPSCQTGSGSDRIMKALARYEGTGFRFKDHLIPSLPLRVLTHAVRMFVIPSAM